MNIRTLLGCLAVLCSALCFYLSTVVIRWSEDQVRLDSAFFVFTRLLLGFFVISIILIIKRQPLIPRRYHFLIGRTVANCIAVYCFYQGVITTSVAHANILNMTYPIFVALFSWIWLKTQRDIISLIMVFVAFIGIWLIISPANMEPELNHLWGIASGISAAVAIIYLNLSRKYHDSETILFYMFGMGTIIVYGCFYDKIFIPDRSELYYLFLSAIAGICGQYLITLGFRYVTAVEGGILSSTRILLAAILGPYIASDPRISLSGWIGAIMIFGANVYLAIRKMK